MSTTQMVVQLDSTIKRKLSKLAQSEGKQTNQIVSELIENYIQNRDMEKYIDDLWGRIGNKFKAQNIKQTYIQHAIRLARAASK